MNQISEWSTKQEMMNQLDMKQSEVDKNVSKLIMEGFIEADYSNPSNPRYKLAEYPDGSHYKKINYFLESIQVRHGLDHLQHKYILEGQAANIKGCEIFEISPKLVWILQKTNNEIFKRELPFDNIILDCDLKIKDTWFKGIILKKVETEGKQLDYLFTFFGKNEYCNDNLLTTLFAKDDKPLSKKSKEGRWEEAKVNISAVNELKVFICNFLDFLNNPEVRIIKIERSKKNQSRRLKQGKSVLPSTNKIIIDGKLKSYYNNLTGFDKLPYSFIVRGHYMRFWNKKKYRRIYQKLKLGSLSNKYYVDDKIRNNNKIITLWKRPFVKGSGMLVKKKYELKKTKIRRIKNDSNRF